MEVTKFVFSFKDKLFPILVKNGLSLLEAAHRNNVPLPGACEGSLACTTCHVVLEKDIYQKTLDTISEREEDLLDQAKFLTHTSRLGCQLKVSPIFTGTTIKIPNISKNIGDEIMKNKNK